MAGACLVRQNKHFFVLGRVWYGKIRVFRWLVYGLFCPPPKASIFTVLFARVDRKRLQNLNEIQKLAFRSSIFAFSLRFCSGFKKHYKTREKVTQMLPERHFLHTVSAQTRFFESTFEKTIFRRDRVQKMRNLSL